MEETLNELLTLTKENNKILRGMRRSQRWSSFVNYIYYLLLIGSFVGAYYYLQPILDSVIKSYQGILSDVQNVKSGLPSAQNLNISPDTVIQLKKTLNIQ